MLDFYQQGTIVVTCKDRSAPYLEQEIRELGYNVTHTGRTAVELQGHLHDCLVLNMHLRTASHVLFEIKTFNINHPDELYKQVKSIPWEQYLDKEGFFSVISNVRHPSVDNPLFVNVRIKDAIVDRFRDKTGQRPNSGSALNGAVFQLFWKDESATLYINTSGETLAKHGYRKIPGKAPMMEDLAAANILVTNWRGGGPFINPMCGAGTMAIEAALFATDRYPGLYRSQYAIQHLNGYEPSKYEELQKELQAKVKKGKLAPIIATDISKDALRAARQNAAYAGVDHLIRFELCDFADTTIPEMAEGVIFFNPEYGERLGEIERLEGTYKRMGDFLKQRCAGYTGFIFTGNLDLAKRIGLRASRRIEFYNGTLDCRLLKFEMYGGTKRAEQKPENS
jgi:putative N6-adenine-specific DNA methylase